MSDTIYNQKTDVKSNTVGNIATVERAGLKKYLTVNDISHNYIGIISPFILILDDIKININEVIRVLPKRRIVFKGTILNQFKSYPSETGKNIKSLGAVDNSSLLPTHALSAASSVVGLSPGLCGKYPWVQATQHRGLDLKCQHTPETVVILKLYIDNIKYIKDYRKDFYGYNLLRVNSLNVPKVITSGCDEENKLAYFITNYIADDNLHDSEKKKNTFDTVENNHIFTKLDILIKAIADLHKNNICQQDLHFNNFIISDKTVYYLDWAGLCRVSNVYKKADNFGLFLAQLPIDLHNNWNQYIDLYNKYYVDAVAINTGSIDIKHYIYNSAKVNLNSRLKYFCKKCFRACTDVERICKNNKSTMSGLIKRDLLDNINFQGFISELTTNNPIDMDNKFDSSEPIDTINKYCIETLKNGNTAKVLLLEYKQQKFIVKYYLPGNLLDKVIKTVQYTLSKFINPLRLRAQNSWLNANLLKHLGILTPDPICYLVNKKYGLVQESFFIMQYLDNTIRLDQILEDRELNFDNKIKYVLQLKDMLNKFQFLNIVHNDFKSVNIGFKDGNICVFDLDAMQKYNSDYIFNKNKNKNKDYNRIVKCLEKYPDILDFFKNHQVANKEFSSNEKAELMNHVSKPDCVDNKELNKETRKKVSEEYV